MKRIVTQLRAEIMLVLRNGEQLLLTLVIPVLLLTFFSLVDVLPSGTQEPADRVGLGLGFDDHEGLGHGVSGVRGASGRRRR